LRERRGELLRAKAGMASRGMGEAVLWEMGEALWEMPVVSWEMKEVS